MSKRPVWSWKDVPGAAPRAAVVRVALTLDAVTHGRLKSIADAAGLPLSTTASALLRDLAADDAAAHGEEN